MPGLTPLLACRDLHKRFGAAIALDGVSLDVPEGAFFTLLGPSGCGKTTLLRAIAGFEAPDAGTIALAGTALDGLPPHRRPVNTVFQGYALFPHLSVADNIAFGPAMQRRPRAEIAAQTEAMLALVRLPGFGARMPAQLSGGQQQRVALARALAARPRLLLLDEPLSALDRKLRGEMRDELKRLQAATGLTFIFVTHDQHEALSLSDGVAVMRAGRIEQVGTPADIYERPATRFVADFVGEANLLPARRLAATRFEVAGQILETARPGPPGRPALVLRPERAGLAPPGTASQGLDGTLVRSVYDGPDTTLHIAVGPLELRVRHPRPAPPPGAAVRILIAPAALTVVADEDEAPG